MHPAFQAVGELSTTAASFFTPLTGLSQCGRKEETLAFGLANRAKQEQTPTFAAAVLTAVGPATGTIKRRVSTALALKNSAVSVLLHHAFSSCTMDCEPDDSEKHSARS
jgi:hypothetical protein